MPQWYNLVPGVVTANTATPLPSNAPKFVYLIKAMDVEVASSSTAPAELTVTHTSGTQSAGDIYLTPVSSANRQASWQYGSATTADTVLMLYGYVEGEISAVA